MTDAEKTAPAVPVTASPAKGSGDPVLDALSADETANLAAQSGKPDDTHTDDNAAQPAPADVQPPTGTQDKTGKVTEPTQGTEAAKSDDNKTLTQDELDQQARDLLGLKPKEPNTAEHWHTKYKASSEEGKKLAQREARINARLKEMGLKLIDSEEKADLVADETYVTAKSDELIKDISEKLSQAEKDLALDEPNKFAALIAEKVLKATVRPTPTISARDIKITEPIKKLVRDEVVASKGVDGKPELPDYEALEPYVNHLLNDEQTPQDFKEFMDRSEANYKYGLKLLYGRVHQRVAPLIAAQLDAKRRLEEKKKSAKEDASLTSEATRTGRVQKTKSGQDEAKDIATAKSVW